MKRSAILIAFLLAACRAEPPADLLAAYEPPAGKRAFSLAIDKSQTQFLAPGDAVEVMIMVETPRADATSETRSETLSARAEVLRVKNDWSEGTGLIALALSPEEAQYAALAVDREDRLFLNKIAAGPERPKRRGPPSAPPALEKDERGLSVLAYPDQQEFLAFGDHVDVIATRQGYKAGGKAELTAITLLQDLTVLRAGPPEGNEEWATVQLLVNPEQAKTLARAVSDEEHLSFAVRGPSDRETRAVEPSKMSRRLGIDAERATPRL
ncbi:MAG: RcpC/CpaB family pilus assembly protein [Elusimicrobia bacterium]|nr:RcpC/CpaB family pilus assembly protein [Elusimicrobiota bacterium]